VNNNYCPIPGASQPKEPVRLIDANSILRYTEEFINVGDYYALDAVTHWMPLPNPRR
jgi:hypothetical protein